MRLAQKKSGAVNVPRLRSKPSPVAPLLASARSCHACQSRRSTWYRFLHCIGVTGRFVKADMRSAILANDWLDNCVVLLPSSSISLTASSKKTLVSWESQTTLGPFRTIFATSAPATASRCWVVGAGFLPRLMAFRGDTMIDNFRLLCRSAPKWVSWPETKNGNRSESSHGLLKTVDRFDCDLGRR